MAERAAGSVALPIVHLILHPILHPILRLR